MKSKYVNREMRNIFYQECLKLANSKRLEKKGNYTHLTIEERTTMEILYIAGFKKNFMALFLGRHRSTIGRELERNVKEYWDVNSTKSPYKHKGQENIKYYSSDEAQKNMKIIEKIARRKKY